MEAFSALRATDPEQVGPYRLVARLGSGGMGSVYLGRSPTGRTAAVKVVRPDLAEESGFQRRFVREVTAARRVNGAFTAGVVDADPSGVPPWLATEFVQGTALGAAVEAHGPWPVRHVLRLGAGLAEALTQIHAAGVVHRDLKPSNILLASNGPRVIDFGISAVSEATALTQTGTIVGTPGYMSPEQITGTGTGPATDVFALGAVLVYAATGNGPFGTGASHAVAYRTVHEPPALEGVPAALRDVVESCLDKDPGRRPAVDRLMADVLSRAAGGGGAARQFAPDADWLPTSVARMLPQTGSTLPFPFPGPAGPAGAAGTAGPGPGPAGAAGTAGPGPGPGPAGSAGTAGPGPAGRVLPQQPTTAGAAAPAGPGAAGTTQASPPAGRATGLARRRALFGLAGAAAVAGLGAGGWLSGLGRAYAGGGPAAGGSASSHRPGTLRWKSYAVADADDEAADDGTANLTVVQGLLHVAGRTALYALSTANGTKKWTYAPGNKWEWLNPAVVAAGETLYLGVDGTVHAVRAATGDKLWVQSTAGDRAHPTVRGEALYTVSVDAEGRGYRPRTWLYAASAKTGTERWSQERDQDQTPVALVDGGLYTGLGGVLCALRPDTGGTRWRFDTGGRSLYAPTVGNGTVYVSGLGPSMTEGAVYAVSAATGKKLWEFRENDAVFVPPTTIGDTVLVGNVVAPKQNTLRALDAKTGEVVWERRLADDYLTRAVAADGTVYVVGDGVLYALRADTGGTVWQYATKTAVHATPLVHGGTVYLSSYTGTVYAIRA
ncbi:protein kinase domain-containing protein [Streptomyces sp. enrichment culture]|uniref:protein kinase domain-containing protein n=1 Tax=Streptomyces sp. enrichment culture TaxID=1795815 RepID=UPI003F57833F